MPHLTYDRLIGLRTSATTLGPCRPWPLAVTETRARSCTPTSMPLIRLRHPPSKRRPMIAGRRGMVA